MSKWKISEELSDENHIVIDTGERLGCILIERHIDGKDLEDIPNAQLISAAPELYEALKNMFVKLEMASPEVRRMVNYNEIEQAIYKAEGKS